MFSFFILNLYFSLQFIIQYNNKITLEELLKNIFLMSCEFTGKVDDYEQSCSFFTFMSGLSSLFKTQIIFQH
jgi:hypothetical protein